LLAEKAGIDLAAERAKGGFGGGADALAKSEKDRLYMVMEAAAAFFEGNLIAPDPLAVEAREYVKKRGITEETARLFRIGFAPNEWRLLYTYLREKKFSDSEIEKAGLAKRPDSGENSGAAVGAHAGATTGVAGTSQKQPYDRFRDRIMFPIMDSSGRVIAFSGRIIHDDGKSAKYLNSPDTPLYNKSTVLYGIDKAKSEIRTKNYVIMVEGQMDLVLSHQAGIKNTVAVSGTALAEHTTSPTGPSREQIVNNLGIVRRLSPNVILAFDSDSAGRKAAMRSAQIAFSLGMDVKIAAMPDGKDPADMVLENPEAWKNVLRAAKPVVEFQIDGVMTEAKEKKLDNRKIPLLLRERVLPFIAAISGEMEKSYFVKMIHDRTQLSEDSIRADLKEVERKIQAEKSGSTTGAAHGANARQSAPQGGIVSSTAQESRLDMISRKLFGLLAYLTREQSNQATAKATATATIDIDGIRAAIKKIAGDERYNNLIRTIESAGEEIAFEAELFFGSDDSKKIQKSIDELLVNFEEDIVRTDLAASMAELIALEKNKPKNDGDRVVQEHVAHELMKKCQALGIRLATLTNRRPA
jgi:DNA primase